MLNKLLSQIRKYDMIQPGDRVVCAVSGGADSMALLWAMYLLKEKLQIQLEATHFNHGLRGAESDGDEAFVRDFCSGYGITCHVGSDTVVAGKKGLEAAARNARYSYFFTLSGKIATAHTADDNAETVLMHLVRGTGLKGLGGIMPVNGNVIRPMLGVTRDDVIAFLQEYHIPFINDSSNDTDAFLRNRLRHHVMPLLRQENPQLAVNLSAMAMELRQDEEVLQAQVDVRPELDVTLLRQMEPSLRRRTLAAFLQQLGAIEPERTHVELADKLVFSEKPSAHADFPGNIRVQRSYDRLIGVKPEQPIFHYDLNVGDSILIENAGVQVTCCKGETRCADKNCFTVSPVGQVVLRSRMAGDKLRLYGGTKSVKKLFIDRKIPEHLRMNVVVVADDLGILGVQGFGPNLDRVTDGGIQIQIKNIENI